jgi:hypothetical protein
MVTIQQDPTNPERLVLTQTISIYLDKVLLDTLSTEIEQAIRAQAIRDLRTSAAVKKVIAKAATAKLLHMLGADEPPQETV